MPEDVAEAVLDKVKHFTIGFGRAGDMPAAKGTGVLIKHGKLHGILTCAHVDKYLRELKQSVGLVRLNRGHAQQSGTLNMDEVFSYAAGEAPWTKGGDDLAFIHLPPHLVGNIEKDCVFLDAEKNFTKPGHYLRDRRSGAACSRFELARQSSIAPRTAPRQRGRGKPARESSELAPRHSSHDFLPQFLFTRGPAGAAHIAIDG